MRLRHSHARDAPCSGVYIKLLTSLAKYFGQLISLEFEEIQHPPHLLERTASLLASSRKTAEQIDVDNLGGRVKIRSPSFSTGAILSPDFPDT